MGLTTSPSGGGTSAPAGAILAFGGSAAPSGWLLCDGSAVSKTTYAALYAVISDAYANSPGVGNFNIPDFRGRVPAGVGGVSFTALGAAVGEETHTLSTAEIPGHTHDIPALSGAEANAGSGIASPGGTTLSGSTGGDGAHNNIQPSLCVNYIIKT